MSLESLNCEGALTLVHKGHVKLLLLIFLLRTFAFLPSVFALLTTAEDLLTPCLRLPKIVT